MPDAITALANVTLASSQQTVSFTSISGSYRDLILVTNFISTNSDNLIMLLNNNEDSPFAYNHVNVRGSGSNATSSADTGMGKFEWTVGGFTNTQRVQTIIQVFDYAQTDKHKAVLVSLDNPNAEVVIKAGRWAKTEAVTSLQIKTNSYNFAAGSTFALYGVSA